MCRVLGLLACVLSLCAGCATTSPPAPIRVDVERGAVRVATGMGTVAAVRVHDGIGSATLQPIGGPWPARVLLRLQLGGLEHLALTSGDERLALSYLSHSGNPTLQHLWKNGVEGPPLAPESPYRTAVQVFDSNGFATNGLPPANGYFEVVVPSPLLRPGRPLKVDWIDFWRD